MLSLFIQIYIFCSFTEQLKDLSYLYVKNDVGGLYYLILFAAHLSGIRKAWTREDSRDEIKINFAVSREKRWVLALLSAVVW